MEVSLGMSDAMELERLLRFLARWMKSDRDYLAPSLARFLGVEAEGCGPESLADDFSRFRFLLGPTGGEGVFTPDEPCTGSGKAPEPPHARLPASRRPT